MSITISLYRPKLRGQGWSDHTAMANGRAGIWARLHLAHTNWTEEVWEVLALRGWGKVRRDCRTLVEKRSLLWIRPRPWYASSLQFTEQTFALACVPTQILNRFSPALETVPLLKQKAKNTELQLIYGIVLISAAAKWLRYTHTYTLFFLFFSIPGLSQEH